jgi:hypothetical protein
MSSDWGYDDASSATAVARPGPPLRPSGRAIDLVEWFAKEALQTSHGVTCASYWGWFALLLAELHKLGIVPPADAHTWWVELVRAVDREREVAEVGPRHDEHGVDWAGRKSEALLKLTGGA